MRTLKTGIVIGLFVLAPGACQDTPSNLVDPEFDATELPAYAATDVAEQEESGEANEPSAHCVFFTFTAESGLSPSAPVTLLIEGVATEPVTSGEVVVTLPTKAAMDYAGPGNSLYFPIGRTLPVFGRWTLPAMAAGDVWQQRITIPAMEKGYYQVALAADIQGPPSDRGPFLIDEVYRQVWMFISDVGATLTPFFDGSVFPDGARPVAGPIQAHGIGGDAGDVASTGMAGAAASSSSLYTEVVYSDSIFQPAVGAKITGSFYRRSDDRKRGTTTKTVPNSGIVRWTCPTSSEYLGGDAAVPATSQVEAGEKKLNLWWYASHADCGDTITVFGSRDVYLPWYNLDQAASIIEREFGHHRGRIKWKVDHTKIGASYKWGLLSDHITFGTTDYDDRWVAGHEFTHALHTKAMGGNWRADNCNPHYVSRVSSYKCAFMEGLADYGGTVGDPDNSSPRYSWENWTTSNPGTHGKIEGHVAALFHDLIDGGKETNDETEYDAKYVMTVFRTCRIRWGLRNTSAKRNDVSDFVWCLENRVDEDTHDDHFPGIGAPNSASEDATEPDEWDEDDIRKTWIKNVG
ncbi:MAG: hypothetical protein F4Z31_17450 [Gemmatimonadetes bacterium]|nr:hypothetical protein [Gemmatimonadota bacterium]MYE93324.1 hypothetical protein [Gemmatimonadota bacterium]MYJ09653.1 hypothetical protein [Gemmatimonadota bacterium]